MLVTESGMVTDCKDEQNENARSPMRDGDGLQGFAILKRTVANAGHGVRDGDGLQGFATKKRFVANAGHGVGDEKSISI